MRFNLIFIGIFCAAISGGAAEFPKIYNSEKDLSATPPPAQESLAQLQLPPGFKATVFAAEPDVQNPIAMTWDGRGRLWIAENYTYAETAIKFDLGLRDRILIFEDTDGDGKFDTRKIFTENVQKLTSIEVGHGGVWAMCPPQLFFIPDQNGDGIPDGAPEVVLDGFKVPESNYHNFANGLRWGPDGWLYGRCGASAPGEIGIPGTFDNARLPLRGGIWRYHPEKKIVETLACGTVNPWGHDWDENGEMFFINTVSGHLWHMIPGAHFLATFAADPNPRAYERIDMHADHWHFDTGKSWTESREGVANSYGGGHAHIGAMIYQGDNWPSSYRGNLFTLNLHGRRANQEILERTGSGYVAHHGTDCFIFGDKWFRGLDIGSGPDGGVFVLDWNDTGECHESTGVYRTSGRIYKITYGDPKYKPVDLKNLSVTELVKLQSHTNDWFARQARFQLGERAANKRDFTDAKKQLLKLFQQEKNVVIQLRALWSLYAIGGADEKFLRAQLDHPNEHVRVWAIRLLTDLSPMDTMVSLRPLNRPENSPSRTIQKKFIQMAGSDPSGLVRLALASTLQRLPFQNRADLAAPLLSHTEDATDHNLPLMIWYGIIPLGESSPDSLVQLAAKSKIPLVRKFIARRLAEDIEKKPASLNALLKLTMDQSETFQTDILTGVSDAFHGWKKAKKPEAWGDLQEKIASTQNSALQNLARKLSVFFGDSRALDEVKQIALDEKNPPSLRQSALETLIEKRPPDLRQICEKLLTERSLGSTAVRGLSLFDDPAIGEKLANNYKNVNLADRNAVIETLVSRPSFAKSLLDGISSNKIPRADLTPFHARQIRSLKDPALSKKLSEVWGELRDSPDDKKQSIAKWKTKLNLQTLAAADKHAGRLAFEKTCATCHTLYGNGGKIGPDLTGSGRDNLDYLLNNIVDPSGVVGIDFQMSVVDLKDGRTLNGLIGAKTDRTITLKTVNEILTIERGEIESIRQSRLSLMPEGLLDSLGETQVRDLIGYLMHRSQVP